MLEIVFTQNKQGDHQVEVYVSWGEPEREIRDGSQRFTISCTFQPHAGVNMGNADIQDG